jgi:uncharacterized protein YggT (Ycf19 family)
MEPMSPQGTPPQSPQTPPEPGSLNGLRFAKLLTYLLYAYFILAVIVLVLAFFLQLFNASETASFTEWVYRSANRVMDPFRGIFPSKTTGVGSVIDFSMLFGIIIYGIVALLLHSLIEWLDYRIRLTRWKAAHPGQVPPPA